MKWAGLCEVRAAGPSATAVLRAVAWRAADAGDRKAAKAKPAVEVPEGQAACWAGVEVLAADAGVHEKTVRSVLRRLEHHGVLRRERRARHDGSRVRRVEDVLFLDLEQPAVLLAPDPLLAKRRSEAGRRGAEQALINRQVRREQEEREVAERGSATGNVAGNAGIASGQVARSVAADLDRGASGQVAGAPAAIEPGRYRAGGPGVLLQTYTPTRQRWEPEPGTARALGTTAVDDAARQAREADEREARRVEDLVAALAAGPRIIGRGIESPRRLPRSTHWAPIRCLSAADWDRGRDEAVAALHDAGLPLGWYSATPAILEGYVAQIHARMLRDELARRRGEPSVPRATKAEEVA